MRYRIDTLMSDTHIGAGNNNNWRPRLASAQSSMNVNSTHMTQPVFSSMHKILCWFRRYKPGLILGLCPANERQCYIVTTYLNGWVQDMIVQSLEAIKDDCAKTWSQTDHCPKSRYPPKYDCFIRFEATTDDWVWKPPRLQFNSSPPGQNGSHLADVILNAFTWMESFVFQFKLQWSLFLRVWLTITKHWFK